MVFGVVQHIFGKHFPYKPAFRGLKAQAMTLALQREGKFPAVIRLKFPDLLHPVRSFRRPGHGLGPFPGRAPGLRYSAC